MLPSLIPLCVHINEKPLGLKVLSFLPFVVLVIIIIIRYIHPPSFLSFQFPLFAGLKFLHMEFPFELTHKVFETTCCVNILQERIQHEGMKPHGYVVIVCFVAAVA